jgi:hypothetical protein
MREKKEWERVGEEERTMNKQPKQRRELWFGITSLTLES